MRIECEFSEKARIIHTIQPGFRRLSFPLTILRSLGSDVFAQHLHDIELKLRDLCWLAVASRHVEFAFQLL